MSEDQSNNNIHEKIGGGTMLFNNMEFINEN